MKNRLILLPISPVGSGGYNKAVSQDIQQLNICESDHIIVYNHPSQIVPNGYEYIQRPAFFSPIRIINTIRFRVSTELSKQLLEKEVKGNQYREVFCGDVMLYKAARQLFPEHDLTVRFHNLFLLSNIRQKFHKMPLNLKLRLNLKLFSKLEREILADIKVFPVFINRTESDFFQLMFPCRKSALWFPSMNDQTFPDSPKKAALVYFGSHSHHQVPGINLVIKQVFLPLRSKYSKITLNFWGIGGRKYHDPCKGIYHHGDYAGKDLPMKHEALFLNPDLLGGGVKFKVCDWLEKGAAFITTPFGIEGYNYKKNENIIVADIFEWRNKIEDYFRNLSLI